MASVNFEKIKSPQEVKAMLRHCDIDERVKHNHSNEQINKELTHRNLQANITYTAACSRFDKRIAYLDSLEGANMRKDRVLCFGLSIPCPAGLTDEQEKQFFKGVIQCVVEQYGIENFVNAYFHRDEKHTYSDTETKKQRESLSHAHVYVVPAIAEKLNGKEFSSKKNMLKLNRAIHKMCQNTFGIDFMDGSKAKSTKSVETLKNKSREIEMQQRIKDLDIRESKLRDAEISFKRESKKLLQEQQKAVEMQDKASEKVSEYNNLIEQLQKDTQYITDCYSDIKMRYRDLEDKEKERETQKMQQSVTENTNEIYEREQNRLLTAIQTQRRKEDEEDKRKLSADEVANYMIGK